jgi:hypothetical protein
VQKDLSSYAPIVPNNASSTPDVFENHASWRCNSPKESYFITSMPYLPSFNPVDSGEEEASEDTLEEEVQRILREAEEVARWKKRPFYIA